MYQQIDNTAHTVLPDLILDNVSVDQQAFQQLPDDFHKGFALFP